MSLTLSRDQFGKPILKPISVFKDPSLLNNLADSQPAGRDVISFESVTIGNILVDNTLPAKLNLTSSIIAGVADANKALTLDNNRNVSGINKIYVDSIYINGVLLDPSIFKGSAVSVSTDDSSRAELTDITMGYAKPGKALILNQQGVISGLNSIKMEALEKGNEIMVNSYNNDIKMNNIEYFDRFYNPQCVPYFDNLFLGAKNIGFRGEYSSGSNYILWNCYSNSLEIHVAVFSNGNLSYSNDGNVWTSSATNSAEFVNWFPSLSLFLAVGGNNLYTSTNGIDWTTKKIANFNLYCIEWAPALSLFVIGGQSSIYYTNDLNGDWVKSNYNSSNVRQIIYIETSKRFIGRDDNSSNSNSLIISYDGKNWSNQSVRSGGWGSVRNVFYSSIKNIIIITVHGSGGGRTFRNGLYSTDGGFTFKPIYSANTSYGRIIKIVFIEDYSLFVGITDEGSQLSNLAYSVDGINWRGITIFESGLDAGIVSSVIYNKKSGHLFIRTQNNTFGRSQNFKSNLSSLNNKIKSYGFYGDNNKLNINTNTNGNHLVNIGANDGKMINFYNTHNSIRNITVLNGELNITSNSININSSISLNDGEIINFRNITLLNKYLNNAWQNLNFFDFDERNKYNFLLQTNGTGAINIPGILNVKSLTVGNVLFNTANNINEFKGNKAGVASAGKFIISKYGNEVKGINNISCKKIKLDGISITSKSSNDLIIGNKHGINIDKRPVNNMIIAAYGSNAVLAGSFPSPQQQIQVANSFMGVAGTTSDTIYYIKEFSTIMMKSGNIIRFSPINNKNWKSNHILKTSMELFNANINFNKCEYIKELNTIYLSTSVGIYMSKDMYSWKLCNLTSEINSNVGDFTYSPRLRTMLIVSNTRLQMSKNGIDFKFVSNNIHFQKLECVKWIESWGLFVGITSAGNSASVKQFVYSYEGQIWDVLETNDETLIKSPGIPNSIIYSPKLDMAIATEGTNIRYTYDGIIWRTINSPNTYFSGNVIWVDELELFIASSDNNYVILFYSYDGIRWHQLTQATTPYLLNRKWQYIHATGDLINTTNSSTALCIILSSEFFKNNHINENFAVVEENSIISIDNKNNRIGLGVETPEFSLHLGEDMAFKPTTSTWATSSDFRLKEDIDVADLNQCLNNVRNIPLKRFKWRDNVYSNKQVNNIEQIGWIAQDVEGIIPKAVERKNMHGIADCRTLNNDQIIANMYGAVKRLIQIEEELSNL